MIVAWIWKADNEKSIHTFDAKNKDKVYNKEKVYCLRRNKVHPIYASHW